MRHIHQLFWFILAVSLIAAINLREISLAQVPIGTTSAQFRGPIALLLAAGEGQQLLSINRRSGTISVVDINDRRVVTEMRVGQKLSSAASIGNMSWVLATDEAAHELLLIDGRTEQIGVAARASVPPYPVKVLCQPDGRRCFVASLWSRKLAVFDINFDRSTPELKFVTSVSLPFAPRELALSASKHCLVVAEAFGGQVALIDSESGRMTSVRELPAHNTRGLAITADGERLYVSHQILNGLAHTTPDDIHWGMLMGNVVRVVEIKDLEDPAADLQKVSEVFPVGDAWKGGAAPAALQWLADGRVGIAFGGTGEVGFLDQGDYRVKRIVTVPRPTALALSRDGKHLYVSDELADKIAIVDINEDAQVAEISLGPQPPLSLADRGERLFYDGDLSHGGWMSCHSCHPDGHSNGMLNDNLGDGHFGAPKRVLSLLGVAQTGSWAWNGEVGELQTQVKKSIETTMRGRAPTDEQVEALTAFLKSLPPPPPGDLGVRDAAAIGRGEKIFSSRGCARCHAPPEYTTDAAFDVGLEDELKGTAFNPPSLLGVGHRDRLFHDNRAQSLEEVLTKFHHLYEGEFSDADRADLLAFLKSL